MSDLTRNVEATSRRGRDCFRRGHSGIKCMQPKRGRRKLILDGKEDVDFEINVEEHWGQAWIIHPAKVPEMELRNTKEVLYCHCRTVLDPWTLSQ
jgi:hypothetical protein